MKNKKDAIMDMKEKIDLHKSFLELANPVPLVGCCVGGWDQLSKYMDASGGVFKEGQLVPEDIDPSQFLPMYESYVKQTFCDDDLVHTVEPLPFIPWTEGAAGCPVYCSGSSIWSKPLPGFLDSFADGAALPLDRRWLSLYGKFLEMLLEHFGGRYPVSQPILRGPSDILSAIVSETDMIYSFTDRRETVNSLIRKCTDVFLDFLALHYRVSRPFEGGFVIGQYYIWTPGTCIRLQEDAASILSPAIYEESIAPEDERIASVCDYTLMHMHASALFAVDAVLKNKRIQIIQLSKDDGNTTVDAMLPALRKIQHAGKALVLKGRLTSADIEVISRNLDPNGLCIQCVVGSQEEAREVMSRLRKR
ncbi:MAG: hypothetical protein WAX69_23815 [Victivallales bacterium]